MLLVADQRVKGWLLLDNYPPTLALSLAYLLILWLGPKFMRDRKPVSCRPLLVVYNMVLTLLSFYMFYEVRSGTAWTGLSPLVLYVHQSVRVYWCIFRVLLVSVKMSLKRDSGRWP